MPMPVASGSQPPWAIFGMLVVKSERSMARKTAQSAPAVSRDQR